MKTPKFIRCYDNGGQTFDRYTVVYTGRRAVNNEYVGMSANPFHPQGFGQHGESPKGRIDYPTYGHLGKKIAFSALPEDCQKLVLQDYEEMWKGSKARIWRES